MESATFLRIIYRWTWFIVLAAILAGSASLIIGPLLLGTAALAATFGATIAAGLSLLIEYLNHTIRSPSEIMPLLNIPVIGTIAPFGSKQSNQNKLIAWIQPRSTIAEGYRALRVNLLYRENNNAQHDCRVYLVTSPAPAEGKSVTLANLAVTFAVTGMRVLVLDTDLRRPTMHQIFELPNTTGLSNIWAASEALKPNIYSRTSRVAGNANSEPNARLIERSIQLYLSHIIQKTAIPGLDVITSGPVPPNPAELLDTVQMRELIRQIVNSKRYDAVFFDTPPALVVSDSGVLASVAKGQVILVVESGRTRRASAARSVQNLAALSVNVVGVVVNRLNPRDVNTGYGEHYYGYSYRYYGAKGVKAPSVDPHIAQIAKIVQSPTIESERNSTTDLS